MKTLWIILAFSVIAAHSQEVNCQIELEWEYYFDYNNFDLEIDLNTCTADTVEAYSYNPDEYTKKGHIVYFKGPCSLEGGHCSYGFFGKLYEFYKFKNWQSYQNQGLREIDLSQMQWGFGVLIQEPFIVKNDSILSVCWVERYEPLPKIAGMLNCTVRTDGVNDFDLSAMNPGLNDRSSSSLPPPSNISSPRAPQKPKHFDLLGRQIPKL